MCREWLFPLRNISYFGRPQYRSNCTSSLYQITWGVGWPEKKTTRLWHQLKRQQFTLQLAWLCWSLWRGTCNHTRELDVAVLRHSFWLEGGFKGGLRFLSQLCHDTAECASVQQKAVDQSSYFQSIHMDALRCDCCLDQQRQALILSKLKHQHVCGFFGGGFFNERHIWMYAFS